jgi:AraC-like DNA-binding protein
MGSFPKNLCETHQLGAATGEWLVRALQVPGFAASHTRVAGYSDARFGYAFVRHDPGFSQVLACIDGEGEVLVDGGWQGCGPGQAYLTAPHALCAYRVRPGGRWRVCWVLYEEPANLPATEAGLPPRLVPADAAGLHLAIEGLCHEVGGEAEPAALEFWAALMHRHVWRILQPGGGDPRLGQLWMAVRRDLGGDWDVRRMARQAGLGPESLRRLCLRHVGRPPLSHLTRMRMLHAADLLACTREKIASISSRVGYDDAFAFSHAFKREIGMPPSHYRQQHR